MKTMCYHGSFMAMFILVLLFSFNRAQAQMKIGNHPTQINKASILELESNRQGLLLTRITDTAAMTDLNPPDGMLIYSVNDNTLLIRSESKWKALISAGSLGSGDFWSLLGTTGSDSATNFLGTIDATGLRIGTNNTPAIIISRTGTVSLLDSVTLGGNAAFDKSAYIGDSLTVAGTASIGDSVTLHMVRQALPTDSEVLMISDEGIIRKISIDSLKANINISGTSLHLILDTAALSQGKTGPWIDSISRKPDAVVLNLPDASVYVRGMITDSTQAFAGAKSIRDSLAIGTVNVANSNLQVNGNVSMATIVISSGDHYDMADAEKAGYRTIVVDVSNLSGEFVISLPTAGTALNGRIYTIKKIGKDDDAQLDSDVKIVPTGGDTFEDAGTSYSIYNNFTSVSLQANNGKWYFVR